MAKRACEGVKDAATSPKRARDAADDEGVARDVGAMEGVLHRYTHGEMNGREADLLRDLVADGNIDAVESVIEWFMTTNSNEVEEPKLVDFACRMGTLLQTLLEAPVEAVEAVEAVETVEAPVEAVEAPVEAPVEVHVEAPVEVHVEAPVEAPEPAKEVMRIVQGEYKGTDKLAQLRAAVLATNVELGGWMRDVWFVEQKLDRVTVTMLGVALADAVFQSLGCTA